jgi:hypothetical protein
MEEAVWEEEKEVVDGLLSVEMRTSVTGGWLEGQCIVVWRSLALDALSSRRLSEI